MSEECQERAVSEECQERAVSEVCQEQAVSEVCQEAGTGGCEGQGQTVSSEVEEPSPCQGHTVARCQ